MDSRMVVSCLLLLLAILTTCSEGRTKKVVIHVPYKLKKIKHTHTVFKTIHHHHPRQSLDHASSPSDEHEHFHHVHMHEQLPSPMGAHSQPVGGLAIPDFLPDVPMNVPDIPDMPRGRGLNGLIPLYRRT